MIRCFRLAVVILAAGACLASAADDNVPRIEIDVAKQIKVVDAP